MIDKERLQQITLGNLGVLELTYNLCKEVENIEGDFCEAGVAYGGQLINMSTASGTKKIYAFDSFEGIAEHSLSDKEFTLYHGKRKGNPRKSNGITSVSLDQCKQNMSLFVDSFDRFVFVKGWFIDTLPKLTNEKFSFIRLDCDIYKSYKTCLEYLYPRLSVGGYCLIDDWILSGAQKAVIEYFGKEKIKEFKIDSFLGNAYIKKI